jgi:exodeoxyribonuclease V beta subunit
MTVDITSLESIPQKLFVEASAGTGKTFLIEHYVTRSIINAAQDPLFHIRQLAVITFTRAAAQELRLRIKKTLEFALQVAYGRQTPTFAYLHFPQQERSSIINVLNTSLENLQEASITTIHGFCDRLLTFWQETQGLPTSSFVSDKEKREWLCEFLLHLPPSILPEEWAQIHRSFSYDQEKIFSYLLDAIDTPPSYTPPDPDLLTETFRSFLQTFPEAEALANILSENATCFKGNTKRDGSLRKELVHYFTLLQQFLRAPQGILPNIDLDEVFAVPLAKKAGPNPSVISAFLKTIWPILSPFQNPSNLQKKLGLECANAFHTFLQLSNKKTFHSLLSSVATLSDMADFQSLCTSKIKYLIVDEFQDTDAVQWKIFKTLFLDTGRVLFVGDPKQAIYSFRHADVYTYLDAKASFSEHRTLSCNFRSSSSLVEAQNTLFSSFFLPKKESSFTFLPSSSIRSSTQGPAIHFFLKNGTFDKRRRWPDDATEQSFFEWIANESLHHKNFHKQAILVKDRYQAQRIYEYLVRRSIPALAWNVNSLVDTPIYLFLQRALHLIAKPHDKKRLLSLLLTLRPADTFSLCKAISDDHRLDIWARCATEMEAVSQAFHRRGIAGLAHALFLCRWDGEHTVEQSLTQEELIDLEHLLELLSSLPLHSLDAYSHALLHLHEHFDQLTRRFDPSQEGIRILTMHASKGLEFDIVYALGCASRTPPAESPAEADAEKLRQIYVCMTRAKECCYLPLALSENPPPLGQAAPTELLLASGNATRWHEDLYQRMTSSSLRSILSSFHNISITESPRPAIDPPVITLPPTLLSSSLFGQSRSYRSYSSLRLRSSSSSPAFGIRFHLAISQLLRMQTPDIHRLLASYGWENEELASLLQEALQLQVFSSVRLQDIPKDQIRTECTFVDKVSSSYERGSVDLLFFFENKLFLLDWKTTLLSDFSPSYIKEHTKSHYDCQYQIYSAAAKRAYPHCWGGFFFIYVRGLSQGQGVLFLE